MIKIENLQCSYGKMSVIKDLSFNVGTESVGIFGPNGAGKTTLIAAIMGLIESKGKIVFDDNDISRFPTHRIVQAGISLVPQERELFPFLNVRENLELGALYIPKAKKIMNERLDFVYEMFPILKERGKQIAGSMSGGQQRMLAIARALMADPKLLILDEPSLGLQPSLVSELFDKLAEMKQHINIIVTEQNVRESLKAVDRGYVIENGEIVIEETADGLASNDHVIKSYLGI